MKKIIHVNKQIIGANRKHGRNDPPLRVKTYKENIPCREIDILGPSRVIYSPDKPLKCGARVWIETEGEVVIDRERYV